MKRRVPSRRRRALRRNGLPEALADGSLETSQRDDVDQRAASDQVVNGRAIDVRLPGEMAPAPAELFDRGMEVAYEVDRLRDARRRRSGHVPVGERDAVVGRSADDAGTARHAPGSYYRTGVQARTPAGVPVTAVGVQEGVGAHPQVGRRAVDVWSERIESELGRRVHLLVGYCLAFGVQDPTVATREMFRVEPVGGTVMTSARETCIGAVHTYLRRCIPYGWHLAGVEEQLLGARADLVWVYRNPFRVLIDEIKTNHADAGDDAALRDQLRRLVRGGHLQWGTAFVGVRTVPLATPRRSWLTGMGPSGAGLRTLKLPADLEVR